MEERRIEARSSSLNSGRRVVWGALFAGVVMAFTVQLLMGILGVSIGAKTVDAIGEAEGLGLGALLWLGVTMLVSFFAGGWTAARLAGIPRRTESVLHGVLSWGLSTIMIVAFVGTAAGGLFKGVSSLLSNVAQSPSAVNQLSAAARKAGEAVQRQGGVDQALDQAKQAGQEAAGPISGGSFAGFLVLLLSGAAAAWGGALGTPKNLILSSLPAWERRRTPTVNP